MDAMYKITVAGELDESWARALGTRVSIHAGEGQTELLLGPIDQGELLYTLSGLEDANLPILSVTRFDDPFIRVEGGLVT